MTAENLRETGVAWMGLLRKLYEKARFESLSIHQYVKVLEWFKGPACKAVYSSVRIRPLTPIAEELVWCGPWVGAGQKEVSYLCPHSIMEITSGYEPEE